jgi:hypothetical protein
MRKRFSMLVLVACASILFGGVTAMAQDAALVGEAPPPELCTLPPWTIDELDALMEDADEGLGATPVPSPEMFEMPEGLPLLDAEREEVEKDLRRAFGCFNTGDPLQVFSTYTDRYVQILIARLGGMTDEVVAFLSNPQPLEPNEYIRLLEFGEAVLLEDERVVIRVVGDDPTDTQPPSSRIIYLEEVLSGRWLIDDVIELPSVEMESGG